MKMLYDKENGIADKFLAYNKLLFNDNITTLSFFIRNPEYAIDVAMATFKDSAVSRSGG